MGLGRLYEVGVGSIVCTFMSHAFFFINRHYTTCRVYRIHSGVLINFGRLIMENINRFSVERRGTHSYSQSHSVHPQPFFLLQRRRGCDHTFLKITRGEMSVAQQKSTERGMEGTMSACLKEARYLLSSSPFSARLSFFPSNWLLFLEREMDSSLLQRQVAYTKRCFFEQGYLDHDQFTQLEELQDDANPNFAEEIVSLFYNDSARLIRSIEQTMVNKPTDFEKLDNYMHQFKGSSSSIGANRVTDACSRFREYCLAGNLQGCIRSFQQVKQEHGILKKKLDTYFQLVRQAGKG